MDSLSDEYSDLCEHISAMFDDDSDECCAEEMYGSRAGEDPFDVIPEDKRLHINSTVCAILYIMNLVESPEKHSFSAGRHGELYLACLSHMKSCSDDDVKYLMRCGVNWDYDEESFYVFA